MKINKSSLAYRIVKANFPNESQYEYNNLCPFGRRLMASIVFSPVTWVGFIIEAIYNKFSDRDADIPFVVRAILIPLLVTGLVILPYLVGYKLVDNWFLAWLVGFSMIVGVVGVVVFMVYTGVKNDSKINDSIYKLWDNSIVNTIKAFYKANHDKVCPIIEFEEKTKQ